MSSASSIMTPLPEESFHAVSENHDDNVQIVDLADMENELQMDNLEEDDKAPLKGSEIRKDKAKLLKTHGKIKSDMY